MIDNLKAVTQEEADFRGGYKEPEKIYFCKTHNRALVDWVDHVKRFNCPVFTVYVRNGDHLGAGPD